MHNQRMNNKYDMIKQTQSLLFVSITVIKSAEEELKFIYGNGHFFSDSHF